MRPMPLGAVSVERSRGVGLKRRWYWTVVEQPPAIHHFDVMVSQAAMCVSGWAPTKRSATRAAEREKWRIMVRQFTPSTWQWPSDDESPV